jgi:itaconate CoA-transferase
MTEFLDHPQLTGRGRWTEIGSEAGPLRALPPPVALEGIDPVMGDVPALGQHTAAVLSELGFDADTIARWKKEAVI